MADQHFGKSAANLESRAIILDPDLNDNLSDTIILTETSEGFTKTVTRHTAEDLLAAGYVRISSYKFAKDILRVGHRPVSWAH